VEREDHGELEKHRIVDLKRLCRIIINDGGNNDDSGSDDVIRNNLIIYRLF
jgi:hypothetical protein